MEFHYDAMIMATAGRTATQEGIATRGRVARFCRDQPRTVGEIAAHLGRNDGGARYIIAAMSEAGQIEKADRSDVRAAAWKLTRTGKRELLQRRTAVETGQLAIGNRVVVIIDQGRGLPVQALAELIGDDTVAWCARLDGVAQFVVVFDEPGDAAADRLRAAVAETGGQSAAGRAAEVIPAPDLRAFLAQRTRHTTHNELGA